MVVPPFAQMVEEKSHLALMFPGDARHKGDLAVAGALRFLSFTNKIKRNDDCDTWREAVRRVRPGDTVYIWLLVNVPTKRGVDELPPVAQVQEFVREVEANGGVLIEVYSGRRSVVPAERRDMIKAAMKSIRGLGRKPPSGFRKPGRQAVQFTAEQWAKAEAVWCDLKMYPTRAFAGMHLPEGFTEHRAHLKWGGREQAHKKWLRRMASKK